jgi:thymidylate synthase
MNNLDKQYQALLQDILDNGVEKKDRTGTGTISVFGRQIRHNMKDGKFPLLTTKKMAWRTMVTELLWFLRGDTNIKYLVDNDCHIWDGDAYKNYLNVVMYEKPDYLHENHGHLKMSVKKEDDNYVPLTQEEFINRIKTDDKFRHWGELGPIYGKQWRSWTKFEDESIEHNEWYKSSESIDQIANLINDLKTNPDSRRLMVNAWNVGELDQMVLPPCHYGFQVYTRELSLSERNNFLGDKKYAMLDGDYIWPTMIEDKEKYEKIFNEANIPTRAISLMWNQRSCDVPLGIPMNIASYGLLLEIIAKLVNMVPDELIGNLGDCHIYLNQIEGTKEQIGREPFELPKLNINTEFWPYESGECGVGPIDSTAVLKSFNNDNFCKCLLNDDIQLSNYQYHPKIYFPLSN